MEWWEYRKNVADLVYYLSEVRGDMDSIEIAKLISEPWLYEDEYKEMRDNHSIAVRYIDERAAIVTIGRFSTRVQADRSGREVTHISVWHYIDELNQWEEMYPIIHFNGKVILNEAVEW